MGGARRVHALEQLVGDVLGDDRPHLGAECLTPLTKLEVHVAPPASCLHTVERAVRPGADVGITLCDAPVLRNERRVVRWGTQR